MAKYIEWVLVNYHLGSQNKNGVRIKILFRIFNNLAPSLRHINLFHIILNNINNLLIQVFICKDLLNLILNTNKQITNIKIRIKRRYLQFLLFLINLFLLLLLNKQRSKIDQILKSTLQLTKFLNYHNNKVRFLISRIWSNHLRIYHLLKAWLILDLRISQIRSYLNYKNQFLLKMIK